MRPRPQAEGFKVQKNSADHRLEPGSDIGGRVSQCSELLRFLQTGRAISSLVALDKFGVFRLAARVHQLKQRGFRIATRTITVGKKKFASYILERA